MAGFVTRWQVSGDVTARTITLPLYNSGVFNCTVNWGDGTADSTVTTFDDADRVHTYALNGTYDITITGECPAWSFNNGGDKLKIVGIINWGDAVDFGGFQYLTNGFYGCTNLTTLGTGKVQAKATLVSMYRVFFECAGLTIVPSGLFDNCVNVSASGFYQTFYNCTSLTTIPSGLFDNCVSVSTSGFYGAFTGCIALTAIPSGLFDSCINVSTSGFVATFQGCATLTTIPSGLFDNCVNVSTTGFSNTFLNCTNLTTIPTDLFRNNINATGFLATFYGCSSLLTVPADLFKYNTAAVNFSQTFYSCTKLQLNKNIFYADGEQGTRFLNKTVDFSSCFNRTLFTGAQGTAPDLWNCNFGTGSATPTICFTGAGNSLASLTNYAEIPTYWGGPYTGLGYWTSKTDVIQGLKSEGVLRLYHDYRSGTLYDYSGTGNHGTASVGSIFTKRGAQFLAITDEITVASSPTLSMSNGSMIVLADFESQKSFEALIYGVDGATLRYLFLVSASPTITLNDGASSRILTTNVTGKKCVALSFTFGGIPIAYINGALAGNLSGTTSPVASSTGLQIGNYNNLNKLESVIRSVIMCSRPLTATEHQAVYQQLQALS